jgi:hypothetical protein
MKFNNEISYDGLKKYVVDKIAVTQNGCNSSYVGVRPYRKVL